MRPTHRHRHLIAVTQGVKRARDSMDNSHVRTTDDGTQAAAHAILWNSSIKQAQAWQPPSPHAPPHQHVPKHRDPPNIGSRALTWVDVNDVAVVAYVSSDWGFQIFATQDATVADLCASVGADAVFLLTDPPHPPLAVTRVRALDTLRVHRLPPLANVQLNMSGVARMVRNGDPSKARVEKYQSPAVGHGGRDRYDPPIV